MKIKQVACEQFAGITNRTVRFQDGLNLIYGKNESGKSTLVNLISRTLFQGESLDGRSDKAFIANYFPEAGKARCVEKRADGTLTLETDAGDYTLEKQWDGKSSKNGSCVLRLPDGTSLRDAENIRQALRDVLHYGEGVYNDLLFSSQKNTASALANLLSAKDESGVRQELVDTVTRAFAQSDGISTDALGRAIEEKIVSLGSQWDVQHGMPGPGRKKGAVRSAYEQWERTQQRVDMLKQLEANIASANSAYDTAKKQYDAAQRDYKDFEKYAVILTQQQNLKEDKRRTEKEASAARDAMERWPQLSKRLSELEKLKQEQADRQALDLFDAAKKQQDTVAALQKDLAARKYPTQEEVMQARQLQQDISKQENALRGINLVATLKRLGKQEMLVTSLRTGKTVELTDDKTFKIQEAVKITVPGVLELQLAPPSLDVAQVQSALQEKGAQLQALLTAYQAADVNALATLQLEADRKRQQLNLEERELNRQLQGTSFAELEVRAQAVTAQVRPEQAIAADLQRQCMGRPMDYIIGQINSALAGYVKDYETPNDLTVRVDTLQKKLETLTAQLSQVAVVPAQYAQVTDVEGYKRNLKYKMEQKAEACSARQEAKTRAETTLENVQNAEDAVSREDLDKVRQALDEQKELLRHWLHIREVFQKLRDDLHANPMQDIADSFVRYLGMISGGHVDAELPNMEKLDMQVYSDGRPLDFDKLSEGTKDTVSLAFRLAVLDHLFPEGGGVIVLDDPFTDMDEDRVRQSCALVKACAEKHQVIFLTCREEYLSQLGGHCISLEEDL